MQLEQGFLRQNAVKMPAREWTPQRLGATINDCGVASLQSG
jgi:hypothetical protein